MLLDRRTFILTASSFAAAYSNFCPPLLHAAPLNVAMADPRTSEIRFRIEGWNFDVNSAVDEYVLRISQNWRCAWR